MADGTQVDYGPLATLIGTWRGDKGMDVAPDPAGVEENPYFETIVFAPIGAVTNANEQVLAGLRYHQCVSRKSTGLPFHDMRDHARTVGFRHRIVIDADTLTYDETTLVDIYGRRVEHTDTNILTRA